MIWNSTLKREIPINWSTEFLENILIKKNISIKAEDTNGLPYTPMDSLPIKKMSFSNFKSDDEANSSLLKYNKYSILFGAMRAYFHRVCIAPFDGITRTTTFVLEPNEKNTLGYSYQTLNQDSTVDYAVAKSIGTQQPYAVWENSLEKMNIPKVPLNLKVKYSTIVEPYINAIIQNNLENLELTKLRDYLLPLLMNGQITIK